jgi:hypothetical protein
LDYTGLATQQGNARPAPILCKEYYLQVLQGTANLTNANGQAQRLTTFLWVDDLWTLSAAEVKRGLLNVTHQDGPYDLLVPNFNLTLCQTNSLTIYGELKLLVVCLALDTIHDTLFKVLVPGYSIKPHYLLNHIWQCYVNTESKTVQLSAQAYYSTFLNAIHSFYDLEEHPIDLTGIFQDHINLSLQKRF